MILLCLLVQPRVPSIAVAAGPYVFIYRQLRPYRKWACPPLEISQTENDIWRGLKSGEREREREYVEDI